MTIPWGSFGISRNSRDLEHGTPSLTKDINAEDEVHFERQAEKEFDDDEPLCEDKGDSKFWTETIRLAEERDKEMIKEWNDSMDNLVLFATLFSAIVTAFLVESYQGLSEDSADVTNALLRWQIAASQGIPQSFDPLQPSTFEPSSHIIRVNCLWFASLVISLGVTVVTVLAKQWIDDYDDYQSYPGSPRDRGKIRQSRYTNLRDWRVPAIIDTLPTLLLIALGLFFVGLVEFLWLINVTVAKTALAFISVIAAFFTFTTISPMLSPRCAYKTPVSTIFLVLGMIFRTHGNMAVSPLHLSLGWRGIIRRAEQRYIKAAGPADTTAQAIAWLLESSTEEHHTHAAIRATAGLMLAGTGERLKLLRSAGMTPEIVEGHLKARCRSDPSKTMRDPEDGMLIAAGVIYLQWCEGEGGVQRNEISRVDPSIRATLEALLKHTDKNLVCYACAALLSCYERGGGGDLWEDDLWHKILELFKTHSDDIRVKALETILHALKPHLESESDAEHTFELYRILMAILDSRARAWKWDADGIFRLTSRDRSIIGIMPSLFPEVEAGSRPSIHAKPRHDAAAPKDLTMALYALLILLEPIKGIAPSEERFIAVAEIIPKIFAPATAPGAPTRHSLSKLRHNKKFQGYSDSVLELFCQKLFATKDPKGPGGNMWVPILKAYLVLEPYSKHYPDNLPDLDIPAATRLMNASTQDLLHPLLSVMMGRGNFWIHIKELIPQASIKQLQNLAISVMPSPGGKSFRPEVMVKQEVLLDITRRLDSIFIDSGLPFDDDHFKLVCHLADMTGYVCRYEYHIIMTPTVGSGIVPSLVKAWEAMKGSRGDAWLKDRIEIWGGAGPAPWEGNNDARRLRWLIRRAERGGRYLTRPDADAPGH